MFKVRIACSCCMPPQVAHTQRGVPQIDRTAIACVIMAGGVTAGYFSIRCWGESWRWSAVAVNVLVGGLAAWGVFAPSKDTKRRILVAVLFALELAAQFPPVFYEMKRDWDSGGGDGVLGLSPPVAEIVGWGTLCRAVLPPAPSCVAS